MNMIVWDNKSDTTENPKRLYIGITDGYLMLFQVLADNNIFCYFYFHNTKNQIKLMHNAILLLLKFFLRKNSCIKQSF